MGLLATCPVLSPPPGAQMTPPHFVNKVLENQRHVVIGQHHTARVCCWSGAGQQEGAGGQAEAATDGEGRRSRVKEFQIPALRDLGWWLGNNGVYCRHSAPGTV